MLTDKQLKELTKGSRQSLLFMRKIARFQELATATEIFKELDGQGACQQDIGSVCFYAELKRKYLGDESVKTNKELEQLEADGKTCRDCTHSPTCHTAKSKHLELPLCYSFMETK